MRGSRWGMGSAEGWREGGRGARHWAAAPSFVQARDVDVPALRGRIRGSSGRAAAACCKLCFPTVRDADRWESVESGMAQQRDEWRHHANMMPATRSMPSQGSSPPEAGTFMQACCPFSRRVSMVRLGGAVSAPVFGITPRDLTSRYNKGWHKHTSAAPQRNSTITQSQAELP